MCAGFLTLIIVGLSFHSLWENSLNYSRTYSRPKSSLQLFTSTIGGYGGIPSPRPLGLATRPGHMTRSVHVFWKSFCRLYSFNSSVAWSESSILGGHGNVGENEMKTGHHENKQAGLTKIDLALACPFPPRKSAPTHCIGSHRALQFFLNNTVT